LPEVRVERAILLRHENDVVDRLDAGVAAAIPGHSLAPAEHSHERNYRHDGTRAELSFHKIH
jgi:hypothetical protein